MFAGAPLGEEARDFLTAERDPLELHALGVAGEAFHFALQRPHEPQGLLDGLAAVLVARDLDLLVDETRQVPGQGD